MGATSSSAAAELLRRRTYVLVHGAWFGGWVWKPVSSRLRSLGHDVSTPTLTGLGERKHLAGNGYGLETHVQDVVAHIEMQDLENVELVGWSYGGMVTTGVLARIPQRIRSMTFLDAFAPQNGKSLADYSPKLQSRILEAKARNGYVKPLPIVIEDDKAKEFASPRMADQFWQTFMDPVKAAPRPAIPFTYIRCRRATNPSFDAFREEFAAAEYSTHVIDSGHVAMLDHADETAGLLAGLA